MEDRVATVAMDETSGGTAVEEASSTTTQTRLGGHPLLDKVQAHVVALWEAERSLDKEAELKMRLALIQHCTACQRPECGDTSFCWVPHFETVREEDAFYRVCDTLDLQKDCVGSAIGSPLAGSAAGPVPFGSAATPSTDTVAAAAEEAKSLAVYLHLMMRCSSIA
jgi:hypothetical protein